MPPTSGPLLFDSLEGEPRPSRPMSSGSSAPDGGGEVPGGVSLSSAVPAPADSVETVSSCSLRHSLVIWSGLRLGRAALSSGKI